jgi:hypothetical protein
MDSRSHAGDPSDSRNLKCERIIPDNFKPGGLSGLSDSNQLCRLEGPDALERLGS